jgi:hypothetical protein
METQNVTTDTDGHYTALLGATQSAGLPAELFTSEQARWVGVQVQGQPEQPRVLLVSAPYALKAGDAETIGGLPPSAFVLAAPSAAASGSASSTAQRNATPDATTDVTTTGGTANYLPFFNGASSIVDSVVYQTAAGRIGIGTTTPAATLDVKGTFDVRGSLTLPESNIATATAGYDSHPLDLEASVFNSGTSAAVLQTFRLKAEPSGNDTATASGVLSLLYGSGTATPAETGLQIASDGRITFATGQTFPGAGTGNGTVTSVGSGAGLTGGPITNSGSLSIATGGVSNTMLANPSLTVTAGTDLTGGGAVILGGSTTLNLDITKVPQLATANTFAGSQTVKGSTYMIGDSRVDYNNSNTGSVSPGIRLGSGDTGEGISSDRAGTVNKDGIDLYTAFNPRLSVSNTGLVGVGTTTPAYTLDVRGTGNFLSTAGNGVTGTTSATSSAGISGANTATSGPTYGVSGTANSPSGTGTSGTNLSSGGYGVYGQAAGTALNSTGVYGTATSSSGTEPTYGVYGTSATIEIASDTVGAGVAGTGSVLSSTGSSAGGGAGVWGDGHGSTGVYGTADDSYAIFAFNNSGSDIFTAALGASNTSTAQGALVFATEGAELDGGLLVGTCSIDVDGNLSCDGTVTSSAQTAEGR